MANDPVTLLHEWFEHVWNRGDIGAIDRLLAPDVVIHGLQDADGRELQGRQGFIPFFHRFREAFRRARAQLCLQSTAANQERLIALIADFHGQGGWDRIALREQGCVTFLKPEEIDWVESEGNYARLHIKNKSYLLRETMTSLEERLAARKFLRISRSALVNLERVKEWRPLFHGDSVLVLEDGMKLSVSRVFREGLDQAVARLG